MGNSDSVVEALLGAIPQLRSQLFFKTSLTALSHAMEDQVLAGMEAPLVIANFQQERFYRQEASRYQRIADLSDQVYVLSAAGTSFEDGSNGYETIAFTEDDTLTQEWHLVVIGAQYTACLICRERDPATADSRAPAVPGAPALDQTRRFEGVWTQDSIVCHQAANLLLDRIAGYRPALTDKISVAKKRYMLLSAVPSDIQIGTGADPFTQRLVTYLQAGQYKLLKAYKAISIKEQRERLVNSITSAIRRSLNPEELFQITVDELGQALSVCRCIIYRCPPQQAEITIRHEHRQPNVESLINAHWPIEDNPLLERVQQGHETIVIPDTHNPPPALQTTLDALNYLIEEWQIRSWALVPLVYQQRLLGMIELHQCQDSAYNWSENDLALLEAVAAQLSVAIIQADAYAHLQDLNQQLEALERTRSNLIAITGHELRTPLSTIQVCLESLATEPDMPEQLRNTMLTSALDDAERMRKLVQDFLTLSRLESGRIEWNFEALTISECLDLALSSVQARQESNNPCAAIDVQLPPKLPMIRADGEWVVEVIVKLLDNACKFTELDDQIAIAARPVDENMIQVTIADTGRGIEPYRLEAVFDRFYQEEGALRRTTGGTGLGLAMCRQIIEGLGGRIWATSAGKDQGSQFHFTLPIAEGRAAIHLQHSAEETLSDMDDVSLSELERRNPYILE
ncbi:DICT sensory domain-containing protein [Oscillatoria sp. CS-180]|uniref:DICT sensory domain-containing protein n=1 Tax=Oscillatoria sp. CS-180 TaxID=3021720 RepID=UPI00232E47C8|nr:DICT sensory domain-containing protein [Oscillatoria sp. CS-180]MDB9527333.1 DICT sensory domain-containing protein [Oscillatoria sp. CS-180]